MRKLLECEIDFWNSFSICILIGAGFTMNINDGKISEMGNDTYIDTDIIEKYL